LRKKQKGKLKILIKNARLIDPRGEFFSDLLVEGSRIGGIDEGISCSVPLCIDAEGKCVLPGLLDLHVHLRDLGESYKETIFTGTLSGLKGGYTLIVNMPNTVPPLDNLEVLGDWVEKAKKDALVGVKTMVCLTEGRQGERLAPLEVLAKQPFVVGATDDGDPVLRDSVMEEALRVSEGIGLLLAPHCEDGSNRWMGQLRSFSNEPYYVERDLKLMRKVGGRVHFQHISMKESLRLIHKAKKEGLKVSFEVTPHHLLVSERDLGKVPEAKVNPPLRSPEDVHALQEALAQGLVDVISTDHAPHADFEKQKAWEEMPSGVVGLEVALPVLYSRLVLEKVIGFDTLVRLMCFNPARVLGLKKGYLRVGAMADLVIFNPYVDWEVDPQRFSTKGRYTPFKGWKVKGKVEWVFVKGKPYKIEGSVLYDFSEGSEAYMVVPKEENPRQRGNHEKHPMV